MNNFNYIYNKKEDMCYNTTLSKTLQNIEKHINTPIIEDDVYKPSFMIDGFNHPNLYIIPQNESNHIYPASWGLVPNHELKNSTPEKFYKDAEYNTLNARSNKLFSSSVWRKPIFHGRCLIFADGFFEPHHKNGKSQPYFCHIPNGNNIEDRELFTFAGVCTTDGEGSYYASIITTDANPFFAEIHNAKKRMPLVLDRKFEDDWLDSNQTEIVIKDLLNGGFTTKNFDAYPVSNDVYKRHLDRNKPEILNRVKKNNSPTLF